MSTHTPAGGPIHPHPGRSQAPSLRQEAHCLLILHLGGAWARHLELWASGLPPSCEVGEKGFGLLEMDK